jgi:hypothetical protein
MSTLLLKFAINLENYPFAASHHYGPLFHRWLPDGEKDAIVLNTRDPQAKLRVWLERRGFVANKSIRFDYERREVDCSIISTQAVLEAGPLFGIMEIQELSEEELRVITNNETGNEAYMRLGKRVIKLIYPPLRRFIEILRSNYGQHWIPNLGKWDSRRESLGNYCHSTLQLKWSLDNGKTWNPFEPDKPSVIISLTILKDFSGYLTGEDWKALAKVVQSEYEPTIAGLLLCRAQQLLDQGSLKYAFIEGVSMIELAVSEFAKSSLKSSEILIDSVSSFWGLPLKTQMTIVAAMSGKVPKEDLENTVRAIDIRNKIVHEGLDPTPDLEGSLLGLLNTAAALVSGPKFRFLTASPGNANKSVEEWKKDQ